jgi:hypothetical protein
MRLVPSQLIAYPHRQADLEPRRPVRRRLPVYEYHESLHYPDITLSHIGSAVDERLGVGE